MIVAEQETELVVPRSSRPIPARVVYLSHYITLYNLRVLQTIARAVSDFRVLLSTPIEPNRQFAPDWTGLHVEVQKSKTLERRWKHAAGFEDTLYVHLPLDTARRLEQLQPDVVMSLELGARSVAAARYCARHPETRLVLCTYMSEHTEQGRGWMRNLLRRRLLKRADAVTYNGPSCKRYLAAYGVPDAKLFHFPYAADDRTRATGPLERDDNATRHRLLYVGQLSQRKGLMPLLEQLKQYCEARPAQPLQLTMIGEGPLTEQIRCFATPSNLTLELVGAVPAAELPAWMKSHGAAISATLADEWLMVVDESLHAGLPFIGSIYSQAVTTLIRDGYNGWQFDPLARPSLATALDAYLAASPETIAAMRAQARASVMHRTPQWAAQGALDAIATVTGHAGGDDSGRGRSSR